MILPGWFWLVFVFAVGCSIGSFLNVVIYRLPREKSLVNPPSACPKCGGRIRWYDNIPLVSWVLLQGRCRYCGERVSVRYPAIELLTGILWVGVFYLYFLEPLRETIPSLWSGGWFVYLVHMVLLSALVAVSAIDMELWIIPLSVCWFLTGVGVVASGVGPFVMGVAALRDNFLLPSASAGTAALAVGGMVGLGISLVLLWKGVIKRSYEDAEADVPEAGEGEDTVNHRREAFKEVLFLLPVVVCALAAYLVVRADERVFVWWVDISQRPAAAGVLGSLFGYLAGCGVVWAVRIFGTLAFGKEAMGLGDVHLMGAAGTIVGAEMVAAAFFIAPFFGLAWAGVQMFFRRTKQIPYGPFLSMGLLAVIIFHDQILSYLVLMVYHR